MFKVAQLSFNKPKPLCRISTLTYEHTQRNITALTPDIYCYISSINYWKQGLKYE